MIVNAQLQQLMAMEPESVPGISIGPYDKKTKGQRLVSLGGERKVVVSSGKPSRNKQGENDFAFACRVFKLPEPQQQFKLLKSVQTPRKDNKKIPNEWKFDFAWPDYKLIVEIDGGVWMAGGGAHSHPVDIVRNMAKRNDAALAGFVIVAFTPQQVKKGEAIAFTQKMLVARGWKR